MMPSSTESTSISLLELARARDPEAWRRLVRIYGPLAYRWARKAGLQADDAADIVQDMFARMSTHLETFQRDRPGDSLRGWLWTICQNQIRDRHQKLKSQAKPVGGTDAKLRLEQLPESAAREADDELLETQELRHRALLELRDLFEARVWEAFWGVVVAGRTPRDVAEDLGISVWSVYKAKTRVLMRVRRELQELVDLEMGLSP